MNYPRVNLLKKSEQRYQGAVSRRFITISAVVTPILLIAVVSGIKLIQYTGVQSDLKASREIWRNLEPKLALFKEENLGLSANRQVLVLFDGWKDSQIPLVDLMDEIQDTVPGNIQFTRLLIRGQVAPGVYEKAEEMELGYSLQIDGISQGSRAEEVVWRFHKELLATGGVQEAFDSIDLTDMRKRKTQAGVAVSEFRINGSNASGGAR